MVRTVVKRGVIANGMSGIGFGFCRQKLPPPPPIDDVRWLGGKSVLRNIYQVGKTRMTHLLLSFLHDGSVARGFRKTTIRCLALSLLSVVEAAFSK